jgi:hypothetical protein
MADISGFQRRAAELIAEINEHEQKLQSLHHEYYITERLRDNKQKELNQIQRHLSLHELVATCDNDTSLPPDLADDECVNPRKLSPDEIKQCLQPFPIICKRYTANAACPYHAIAKDTCEEKLHCAGWKRIINRLGRNDLLLQHDMVELQTQLVARSQQKVESRKRRRQNATNDDANTNDDRSDVAADQLQQLNGAESIN